MTAVAILPVEPARGNARRYEAVSGGRRAEGATIGGALDALTAQMGSEEAPELVVVQTMEADSFFNARQGDRLQELMAVWRTGLSDAEGAKELEELVDQELESATRRAEAIAGSGK